MSSAVAEIALIFILLIANGVFAMAEIALVAAKRARLKAMAEDGNTGAAAALVLAESPNRFLSTVQIGITVVGIVAGAFGGARISARLAALLAQIPGFEPYAENVAFTVVIVALTYFSLVIGELLPKRLAMLRPEAISAFMAKPMSALSRVARPAVRFLSWSTDALVRLFGIKSTPMEGVSRDEVAVLIREGIITGAFGASETEMVEGVLELTEMKVSEMMTPSPKLLWLDAEADHASVWYKIVGSRHSYFPVYLERPDNLIGVISLRALYSQIAAGAPIHFKDLAAAPLFVPETQNAMQLLESFKTSKVHVAFVVDEFGNVIGMVTLVDVLEAIVGDIPSRESRHTSEIQQRADGSWLVDALVDLDDLAAKLPGFEVPEGTGEEFHTLAGFIINRLEHLPREGEIISHSGWKLEVIDMDGHRIDKILAARDCQGPAAGAAE